MESSKRTVYDLVKGMMTNPDLSLMLRSGIVPPTVLARFDYYRTYLEFRAEGQPSVTAAQLTADKFKVKSLTTIYTAKQFFERAIEDI